MRLFSSKTGEPSLGGVRGVEASEIDGTPPSLSDDEETSSATGTVAETMIRILEAEEAANRRRWM